MFEDCLIPLFENIGVVAQFRLMLQFSRWNRNRGFGYLIFVDCRNVDRAIAQLNNILVSPWLRLQLSVSENRRQLWLSNVNDELALETVIDMIVGKVDPEEISIRNHNGRITYLIKFLTCREAADSRKKLYREVLDFGPNARTHWDS